MSLILSTTSNQLVLYVHGLHFYRIVLSMVYLVVTFGASWIILFVNELE